VKTYWTPAIHVDPSLSLGDAASQLTAALKRAVQKRMISDDIYCFLSGGIDSSAVVSFASEIAGRKIHAVSVGFEEEEENELEDARIMATHVDAEFHQIIASPDSFFDMLDTLVFHHDSPFTDTSAYPTFFAAKLGGRFTDVILTGDGPDQTMGGSSHYVFAVKNDIFADRALIPRMAAHCGADLIGKLSADPAPTFLSKVRRKLYREGVSPVHAAYDLRSYFPDIVKEYLCSDDLWQIHQTNSPYRHPESWFAEARETDDINKYLYADMKFYVPDDLMIKVDRMCMAHGLETLSPFQDVELASVVNQLPGSYKMHVADNGEIITKFVLKEVCRERFPPDILSKTKQGFGIPLEKWLRKDGGKRIKEILLDPQALARPYFKKEALEKLVSVFLSNRGDYFYPNANGIVGLLTLELWHRKYLD
jgi:asparagine synthase (glutamine-hydrolysing)